MSLGIETRNMWKQQEFVGVSELLYSEVVCTQKIDKVRFAKRINI